MKHSGAWIGRFSIGGETIPPLLEKNYWNERSGTRQRKAYTLAHFEATHCRILDFICQYIFLLFTYYVGSTVDRVHNERYCVKGVESPFFWASLFSKYDKNKLLVDSYCPSYLFPVKLWVVSEYTHTVRKSPFTAEIFFDPLLLLDAGIEFFQNQRILVLASFYLLRKGEMEPK